MDKFRFVLLDSSVGTYIPRRTRIFIPSAARQTHAFRKVTKISAYELKVSTILQRPSSTGRTIFGSTTHVPL